MREIDGHTKLAGLLGYPAGHTKSPLIHNSLAEHYGDNLVYVPFEVPPTQLENAVKGAFALGVTGLNVTVPHKSAVIPYLADIDDTAKAIGAVNTLVRCEEGYKGYNTDILGLAEALRRNDIDIAGKTVLLLGAGGAARAVAFLSMLSGASKIVIANRSIEKAGALKADLLSADLSSGSFKGPWQKETGGEDRGQKEDGNSACCRQIEAISMDSLSAGEVPEELLSEPGAKESGILAFQCTSVGLSPHDADCILPEDAAIWDRIRTGVDLIYKPAETVFMKNVKRHGGQAINGLEMLLYQGVIAYELFRGSYQAKEWTMGTGFAVLSDILRKLSEDTAT